jgi:hypothetical protein
MKFTTDCAVGERQRLGASHDDLDSRLPRSACLHEWFRRVRGTYIRCPEPLHEQTRQRPGSAPDIKGARAGLDPCEVDQRRREPNAVATDVPVINSSRRAERFST